MIDRCPDCDRQYVADDPEDAADHARYHEEVTAPDRPKPNPTIARMMDPESGLVIFEASDPDFLHDTLDRISRRFKREMKYDQSGWAPKGQQIEPGAIGVLFCDKEGRTLGGAGIYANPPYKDVSFMIGWVWIAPSYRRSGVFSRALPGLAKRYPGALINFPYSEDMERFADASPYIIRRSGPLYLVG
jgi:hypothetical protein